MTTKSVQFMRHGLDMQAVIRILYGAKSSKFSLPKRPSVTTYARTLCVRSLCSCSELTLSQNLRGYPGSKHWWGIPEYGVPDHVEGDWMFMQEVNHSSMNKLCGLLSSWGFSTQLWSVGKGNIVAYIYLERTHILTFGVGNTVTTSGSWFVQ